MEQYFRTRASVDDEPDLARDRRANDARLKSRFEHIFAKYGKDFEDVGDEIDLDTGEVVVNNGHLESMRHEVDPGKVVSSQVLQVLGGSARTKRRDTIPTSGLVSETSEESDVDEGASVAGTSGYSSSNGDIEEEDDDRRTRPAAHTPDQPSTEINEAEDEGQLRSEQRDMALREQNTRGGDGEANIDRTSIRTSRSPSPGVAPMNLSLLQDSMEAALSNPGQGGFIDPNVIQALGQSIASQLARFMSNPSKKRKSESSSRRATNDSRWEYPVLPGDRYTRTPSPPPPASSSAALFARSPDDEDSIWAAERPRRLKRQRTSLRTTETLDPATCGDEMDDETAPSNSHAPKPRSDGRLCSHCGTADSPKWRIGPDGGYLCNPCGTYYFRYGRPRPSGVLWSASKPDSSKAPPAGTPVRQSTAGSLDENSIPLTSTSGINGYAANIARRMAGDARYARFTVEEEDAIIKLRAIDQLDWKSIGQSVSNRAESSVQCHYRKIRRRPDFEDRLRSLAQATSKSPTLSERVHKGTFTTDQIERASPSQVTSANFANSATSGHRKEPLPTTASVGSFNGPTRPNGSEGPGSRPRFSEEEKRLLVRLREGNMEWTQIATYLPGRTLNSIKAMARRLSLAQYSSMSGDAVSDENVQSHQLPFTMEEDKLILLMRDQESMSFAEMTKYFAGRSATALALRCEHLQVIRPLSAHGVPTLTDVPSHTNGKPGLPTLRQDMQRESVQPLEPDDPHDMMPPPPCPFSRLTRIDATPVPVDSVQGYHESSVAVADPSNLPPPQTPSFTIPTLHQPPPPLEVGPSAWTMTQPTSKGPLPFKPARKSLIPLLPRGPPYTIADPFVSNRHSEHDEQNSHSEDSGSDARRRPRRHAKERARASLKDLYEATYAVDGSTLMDPSSQSYDGFGASTIAAAQGPLANDTRDPTFISDPADGGNKPPSPAVKAHAHKANATPDTKHRVHYNEEESRMVKHLKEQGLSYSTIAAQMPGRTPISIQNHYYYTYTSTVPSSKAQSCQTNAKRTLFSPPLLRRALDNSARRSSTDSGVTAQVVDTTRKFLRENDNRPIGTNTNQSPRLTEAQDSEAMIVLDDEPRAAPQGSMASHDDSKYPDGRPNVHAMFKAFDENKASEMTEVRRVPTSGRLYNTSEVPVSLQVASSVLETDVGMPPPGGRSTTLRRNASSPCVYIESINRSEGNNHQFRPSLVGASECDSSATPQARENSADVEPVHLDNAHDRSHGHEVPSPPADRPIVGETRSEHRVEDNKSRNEDPNAGLTPDNDELQNSATHGPKSSRHMEASPQHGTKRKPSTGRSKRVSDSEVADSDSDAAYARASQEEAIGNESKEDQATDVEATPVKRGRGRPRRSIPMTDISNPRKSAKASKSVVDSATHETAAIPNIINISSDLPVRPELESESNATKAQPMECSAKVQQPTPHSKTSRYSDSVSMIQRPSTLMTPARSGNGNTSFPLRSETSSMARKRVESFSRAGSRESPFVTRDPSGTRRFILATAAGNDDGDEELDELS